MGRSARATQKADHRRQPPLAERETTIEERYALVCQAVAEGIYEWDVETNALSPSARLIEIFGFEGSSLGAADWNTLVHPEDFPVYRAALRDCFKGVTARLDCEYRVRHSDGAYRWIEDRAVPVRNAAGRAIRLVGAVSDITERKSAEQALREALDQQTATTEVLQVINSSPGDLAPVFEAILDKAMNLCEVAFGELHTFDGERFIARVVKGLPAAFAEYRMRDLQLRSAPGTITASLRDGASVLHIADLKAGEAYRSGAPSRRAMVDLGGARTALAVALRKDEVLVGVFAVYRQEVRPFSDKQVALLQNFAAQAVIAMENARLLGELRERTGDLEESLEYQTATSDVLKVISRSTFDLQPVLDTLLQTAARLCSAEMGHIAKRDGDVYRVASTFAFSPEWDVAVRKLVFEPGRGSVVSRTALARQAVQIADLTADPEYALPEVVTIGQMRTGLGVPLLREGEPIGVIYLARQRVEPFTERQIELVRTFADQAVIAIENTRLLTEQREALERQTATAEILRVISSSPTDIQPTFDAIAAAATTLTGAANGGVLTFDGSLIHFVAHHGWTADELDAAHGVFPLPPGRGSLTARAILTRAVVHVADPAADPEFEHLSIPQSGIRATLAVPMLRDGNPIGAITVARREIGLFSDKQIDLLKTFADQAVIAIENVRLFNELTERTGDLQESLEYQTATSDVLKVISRSTFDLQPVLDTLLETAARLCNAEMGLLANRDGNVYRTASCFAFSPEFNAFVRTATFEPGRGSVIGRTAVERQAVHVADIAADPEYAMPEVITVGKMRTALGVPLLREGEPIGIIYLARQRVEPFTERQIELVRTFADQAVIAIENTRLLTEQREALERQTATAEILRVISSSPTDVQPTFDAIARAATTLSGAASGVVCRFDGSLIHFVAHHGLTAAEIDAGHRVYPLAPGRGSITARAILTRQVVHIADLAADPEHAHPSLAQDGLHTMLSVPMLRDGNPIGAISVSRREIELFSDKQIDLLQTFAAQAVIAIENVRLFNELTERTGDLQESLEYQTATSDVLKVISRSTFDLQPVLDTLSETAARLCLAEQAYMTRREGDTYRFVTAVGSSPEATANAMRFKKSVLDRVSFTAGRGSITGRVASEGRVIQIIDVAADPEYGLGEIVTVAKIRTLLGVPLMREGEPIGTFSLARQRVEPFTERQIELVRTFADQAVIAIENSRLLTETREALEQQTATAEVLQVINSSPGDLTPVFDAMVERAMRLCEAAYGHVFSFDGKLFHLVAAHGEPRYVDWIRQSGPRPPSASLTFGPIVEGDDLVHIADIAEDAAYRAGNPRARTMVDEHGIHTLVTVALRKEETLLGTIVLYRKEARRFSDKQIALLQNFAAQAVIAMENARLITETREALEQQTATAEVLQVINSSPGNLPPVFEALLDKALALCGAEYGFIRTYDGESFHLGAMRGVPPEHTELLKQPRRPPFTGTALERLVAGESVVEIADVANQPGYRNTPTAQAMQEAGLARSMVWVALRKEHALLGFVSVFRNELQPFSAKQIALLQNFAAQAVIAMENARLINETREALEQQTATAEVLQVINSSPGELAPVFDAMLDKAMRLCGAAFGGLWTYDGTHFSAVAMQGFPERYAELLTQSPLQYGPGTGPARLMQGEGFVHILDLAAEDAYRGGEPNRRRLVDIAGARTALVVPLRKDEALVGFIMIYRKEVRPFADKQIALLQNFAAQAVIAMENARLLGEIQQRQAELSVTFDNMGDGVAMFDSELRLAAWNRNFQELLDLPDAFLAEPRTYRDYIRILLERGEIATDDIEAELSRRLEATDQELRLERTRPDGRVIEVRRNAVPGGGFVMIYGDITERKRSEEAIRAARDTAEGALRELKAAQANLIQAEKMASLGQLTAGIAHEIKNPLNFVNNFANLSVELLDELKAAAGPAIAGLDEDTRAEIGETVEMLTSNLEKIGEHGRRADGIVKSMLEHSRGGTGERRDVDLNGLVEEALNLAYHGARAQDQNFNITLERDFGAAIAPIELVPQDVTRVFLNLVGNGFYAANKRHQAADDARFKPVLKVTTRDLGDAVEILVRDNGIGMGPEIRDKLFQPFFTTKPTGEGTGLGLSISYDIVTQEHGGTITVDSRLGEFTEFTVRLPRARPAVHRGAAN